MPGWKRHGHYGQKSGADWEDGKVELSLRSRLHVHASAQRLVLSVRLRDWEPWLCWNVGCVHASCHACRHVLSTTIFKHDTSAFGELR